MWAHMCVLWCCHDAMWRTANLSGVDTNSRSITTGDGRQPTLQPIHGLESISYFSMVMKPLSYYIYFIFIRKSPTPAMQLSVQSIHLQTLIIVIQILHCFQPELIYFKQSENAFTMKCPGWTGLHFEQRSPWPQTNWALRAIHESAHTVHGHLNTQYLCK